MADQPAYKRDALPHLFKVSRNDNKTVVEEVAPVVDSLSHLESFVLESGVQKIYVWNGDNASPFEKSAANLYAENLEAQIGSDDATTCHEIDDAFWTLLGGQGTVRDQPRPSRKSISSFTLKQDLPSQKEEMPKPAEAPAPIEPKAEPTQPEPPSVPVPPPVVSRAPNDLNDPRHGSRCSERCATFCAIQ